MIKRTDYHRKGSVIILVVGLLVMLAMIGSTFIIIAHMDRRESRSIATVAPMKQVADGVLQQIRIKLAEDLHINASGVIYGSTTATSYKEQVDFPHEDYDKHLASFGLVDINGDGVADTWRHISNIYGAAADDVRNVAVDDVDLVDTDGWAYEWDPVDSEWELVSADTIGSVSGDAKLYKSHVINRAGQWYYVAVRLIDASSLININSAYSTSAAASGTDMPMTNISLDELTDIATRDSVHNARRGDTATNIARYNDGYIVRPLNPVPPGGTEFLPFEVSDMLALSWGRDAPDTASGRLWEKLHATGQFNADTKPYLTVHSASRDYARRYSIGFENMTHRADLNSRSPAADVFVELFKAFYNAIPENVPGFPAGDAGRRTVAAQLAANVIDYRDASNIPYEPSAAEIAAAGLVAGTKIFGVERQPFITEAWLRMEWDAAAVPPGVKQWSAIELFNPYRSPISLAGYRLEVGANPSLLIPGLPANIPAGERIVIVNKTVEIQAVNKYQDGTLNLRETCTLYRPASGGGLAPVGSIEIGEADLPAPTGPADPPVSKTFRRDDAVSRAKYSVAVYRTYNLVTYLIGEAGCPTPALTNLGRSNVDITVGGDATLSTLPVAPTPVFVRNGDLINLGEVSRIFYVGPSSSGEPLDKKLESMSPNSVSNGRLDMLGAIKAGTDPQIPPACMLGDYMDVLTPDSDNTGRTDTVYGRININTAPWQVIRYLPGISALAQRDLIAKDIVAYRDLLDNTAAGGHNYSGGTRETVLTLPDLREDAGFASPGEIAIPIYRRGSMADIAPGRLPQNTYSATDESPYNYTLTGTADDGLDNIAGDLSKYDIYYSWLSNQVTVRSDVYIAYIRVQIDDNVATTGPVRRYIAVIDRSNCTSITDLPDVLMFAELK